MTKVMCDCIMCRHNASKVFPTAGECMLEEIKIEDFEYQDDSGQYDDISTCASYDDEGITMKDITYPHKEVK